MATNTSSESYTLSVTPVNYSLTAGTNIPAPPDSPPQTPAEHTPRTATLRRGPPTSQPNPMAPSSNDDRTENFRPPTSPASANPYSSPPQRRPSTVRKLLSMTNLRSSFNGSRTSLALPRPSQDAQPTYGVKRPSSPSDASTMGSSSLQHQQQQPLPEQTRTRPRRSSSWFKRKSGIFLLLGEGTTLDSVDENGGADSRESKRLKNNANAAPRLPEISSLPGGPVGGDLGWDEGFFKK